MVPFLASTPSGGDDLLDAHDRLELAMAVLAPRVLAAALLEHDHLLTLALREHRALDRGAGERRRADAGAARTADQQHVLELDAAALVHAVELLDDDDVVLGDLVLLAAGADDCVHRAILRAKNSKRSA